MLFNALLICVLFLALFALALWPVLFRNSKHRTAIFVGANILFAVVTFACWIYVKSSRANLEALKSDYRTRLSEAADVLESGRTVEHKLPEVLAKDQKVSKDLEDIDLFFASVRDLHVKFCEDAIPAENIRQPVTVTIPATVDGQLSFSEPVNLILLAFLIVCFSLVILQPDFSAWNKLSLVINPALLAWIVFLLATKTADESRNAADMAPVVHAVCVVYAEPDRPHAKAVAEKLRIFAKADASSADWRNFYKNEIVPACGYEDAGKTENPEKKGK